MKRVTAILMSLILLLAFPLAGNAELKKGSKGNDVIALQERLIGLGYLEGTADGSFGNKTKEAIESFQKTNGLDVTGVASIKDINVLFSDNVIAYGSTNPDTIVKDTTSNSDLHDANTGNENSAPNVNDNKDAAPVVNLLDSVGILKSDSLIEIKEAGYAMNGEYLHYSVVLHNRSDVKAVEFPSFRFTSRDADCALLGTGDQVVDTIYPGQDYVWAGLGYSLDETPAKVEFEVIAPDDYNVVSASTLPHPIYAPLEVVGQNKKNNRFLGEIYNPNDYAIEGASVVVVFRNDNGALLGGDVTFIDSIAPGAKVPFDFDVSKKILSNNYQIYANPW